jgi:hypothetical protein
VRHDAALHEAGIGHKWTLAYGGKSPIHPGFSGQHFVVLEKLTQALKLRGEPTG